MCQPDISGEVLTLIVFNQGLTRSFCNSIIKQKSIIRNYGNGQFLGFAESAECIDGDWPAKLTFGLIRFDNFSDARRWGYSDPILRQQDWLDQVDMFMMPLEVAWPEKGVSLIHMGIMKKVCLEDTFVNEYTQQTKSLAADNALLFTAITDVNQIVRIRGRMGIQAIEISLWPDKITHDAFIESEGYKVLKELRNQSSTGDHIVATWCNKV